MPSYSYHQELQSERAVKCGVAGSESVDEADKVERVYGDIWMQIYDAGKGMLTLGLDARRKVSVKYNGKPNFAERMGQDDEEYLSKGQQKLPRSQSHSQSFSLIHSNICRAFSGSNDLSAVQTLYRLGKEYQAIPSYRNSEDLAWRLARGPLAMPS